MKKYIHILFLTSLIMSSLLGYSQVNTWQESAATKTFEVNIPSTLSFNLPTADAYTLGFFVNRNDTLFCVGKADLQLGKDQKIALSEEKTNFKGYKNGERLISLLQNKTNDEVYGIEFTFENNNNKFQSLGNTKITGVFSDTWRHYKPNLNVCSVYNHTITVPYGLKPQILVSAGLILDTSATYPVVMLSKMKPGNYSFQLYSTTIQFPFPLNFFTLKYFPKVETKTHYTICLGETLKIVSNDSINKIFDNKLNYANITSPGQYAYTLVYKDNGCELNDTITVSYKSNCPQMTSPQIITPANGDYIVFAKQETVKILDSKLKKIVEIAAPSIWKGTGAAGETLPGGLYYIIHEDDSHEVISVYH